jgi:hypothetical protein
VNYSWSCGGSAVGGACTASYTDATLTPVCSPAVSGPQPTNPMTRTPQPALCANGTATGQTTSGTTYWNPNTQIAQCGGIVASITGSVAPNTTVNYTCAALGYTGATTNLEYNIKCNDTDMGTWGSGTTRTCAASVANSTTLNISCAVRDRTNTGVVFTGSDA